jgi:hypothetical protein
VNTTTKRNSGFRSGAVETFGSPGEPVKSLKSYVPQVIEISGSIKRGVFLD